MTISAVKVRSLLYREWILSKRSLLLGTIATACVSLFFGLIMLSIGFGNLAKELAGDTVTKDFLMRLFYYFLVMMTAYGGLSLAFDRSIYRTDVEAGWAKYTISLPVTAAERSLSHLLFILIKIIAAMVYTLIIERIAGKAAGISLSSDTVTAIGLMVCFTFIFGLIQEYFSSTAKDRISLKQAESKGSVSLVIFGLVIGLILAKSMGSMKGQYDQGITGLEAARPLLDDVTGFLSRVRPFILPLIVILTAALFFMVKRNLEAQKKKN